MLGVIRRGPAAVRALRACGPQLIHCRASPLQAKWQQPSGVVFLPNIRSLYSSPTLGHTASPAAPIETVEESSEVQCGRITQFQELADQQLVARQVINTITKRMKITTMTDVQSLTIPETLKGNDVLAQAKTGTGKTLAFLLPVLQNILQDQSLARRPSGGYNRPNPGDIRAIIISPTRELAEQIAVETQKLAAATKVIVQTAVGGTRKREGLRAIQRQGCHILVGTPGRLKDILSDPASRVEAPRLSALVLDEADRLLDEGFAPEIMEILSYFPDPLKVDRQTLMFSATVPREVMKMVRQTMKPGFKFVKTVSDDEVPTHLSVPQKAVYLHGFENALPSVLELVKNYITKANDDPDLRPFRGIIYFNSTAQVTLAYEAFRELHSNVNDAKSTHPLGRMQIYQIHSRLSQAARTRSSDHFRKAGSAILFSSDVTARGMDFPDVTHVIQVGSPRERESYIHRLGRTARANKKGEGWILLHQGEYRDFMDKVGDLPILEDSSSLQTAAIDMSKENQQLPASTAEILSQVGAAMKLVSYQTKSEAYRASLSVLLGVFPRKKDVVRSLNDLAVLGYCMPEPPALSAEFARKLSINSVPGVNISEGSDSDSFTPDDRHHSFSRGRYDVGRVGSYGKQQVGRPQFNQRRGQFPWDRRGRNRNADDQYRSQRYFRNSEERF